MNQKTVLVTGSTDGIGKATAAGLLALGANVIIHGRNEQRVEKTVQELNSAGIMPSGGNLPSLGNLSSAGKGGTKANDDADADGSAKTTGRVAGSFVYDLSEMSSIREMAVDIRKQFDRLDVLINNAGVYMNERRLTSEGHEMTFAVNHLAPFVLTKELLPLLQKEINGRIVTVSSIAHTRGGVDFDNLQGEKAFSGYEAYALSKLANILFTVELAEKLSGSSKIANNDITANCLHPGVITTKLLQAGFNMTGASVDKGAETSIYLATSPEVNAVSGKYYADSRERRPADDVFDSDLRRKFWKVSEVLSSTVY